MHLRDVLRKLRADSIVRTLIGGAASSFAFRAIGYGLGFAIQLVTARVLDVTSFGYFWYALSWASTLAIIGKLGFDTASVRFIAEYSGRGSWSKLRGFLRYRTWTVAGASLLLSAVVLGVAWSLQSRLPAELHRTLVLLALVLPVLSLSQVVEESLRALKQVRTAQFPLAVLRPSALIVALIIAARFGLDTADQAMVLHVGSYAAALAVLLLLWRKSRPTQILTNEADYSRAAEWRKTARSMMLVSGFTVILFQADIILTGLLISTTASGKYVVASKVASLLVFILTAANFIAGPMIADLHGRRDYAGVQRVVSFVVGLSTIASLIAGLALVVFGKSVLALFGTEFVSAFAVLVVLVAGQLVNAVSGPVGLVLNMTGFQHAVARILAIGALLNIALNVALLLRYGLIGAAIATACTTIFVNVWLMVEAKRKLDIDTIPAVVGLVYRKGS